LGYRLGVIVAGAGSLYLATYFGYSQTPSAAWQDTYRVMAGVMALCVLGALLCPNLGALTPSLNSQSGVMRVVTMVIDPLREFWQRPQAAWILAFVLCFKFGDALATSLATPFYLELQFTKIEIANITKILGPVLFLAGSFVGAEMIRRIGIMRSLWVGGIVQLLSNFFFAALAWAGRDLTLLTVTIGVENFTSGLGAVAFVAYLSALCHVQYTATQYALLSSLMAVGRTVLTAYAGFIVAGVGWFWFFVITAFAAIPGLLILWHLRRAGLTRIEPDRGDIRTALDDTQG